MSILDIDLLIYLGNGISTIVLPGVHDITTTTAVPGITTTAVPGISTTAVPGINSGSTGIPTINRSNEKKPEKPEIFDPKRGKNILYVIN